MYADLFSSVLFQDTDSYRWDVLMKHDLIEFSNFQQLDYKPRDLLRCRLLQSEQVFWILVRLDFYTWLTLKYSY